MITDQQVRRLMRFLQDGNPLSRTAAAAGMSEPKARKYGRGGLRPSALKEPPTWRTRSDPHAEVWRGRDPARTGCGPRGEDDLDGAQRAPRRALLRRAAPHAAAAPERLGSRDGTGALGVLPAAAGPGSRRSRPSPICVSWRSRSARSHYRTCCTTSCSATRTSSECRSVQARASSRPVQGCRERSGGSAARQLSTTPTHELAKPPGRDFTARYRELPEHYGLCGSRNFSRQCAREQRCQVGQWHLKHAIDQRLRLRGSREFDSRASFDGFLHSCVAAPNATRSKRLRKNERTCEPFRPEARGPSAAGAPGVLRQRLALQHHPRRQVPLHSAYPADGSAAAGTAAHRTRRARLPWRACGGDGVPDPGRGTRATGISSTPWCASPAPSAAMPSVKRCSRRRAPGAPTMCCWPPTMAARTCSACASCTGPPAMGNARWKTVIGELMGNGQLPLYETVRERVRGPRTAGGVPDVALRPGSDALRPPAEHKCSARGPPRACSMSGAGTLARARICWSCA